MRGSAWAIRGGSVAAIVALLVVGFALPAWATAPTVMNNFSPTQGPPGTVVTVHGDHFTDTPGLTVKFNGSGGTTAASVNASSNSDLTAMVPCGAADGPIYVQNNDGNATTGSSFDVTAAGVPTVTSFNPASGIAGSTVVTITGTNFCGASQVRFNTTNATSFSITTPNTITATVPSGATTGKISVTTSAGTGTSAANFIVGPPVVSSLSPTIGLAGTPVTINGSNLTGVTAVRFNGTSATFSVVNDTQISTTVPNGATTGPVSVTNAVGTTTGPTFTVGVPVHDRSVSFSFARNSRVSGQVSVGDGFDACNSFVAVVVQKQKGGGWKWVDTTATTGTGSFKTYIPPSSGTFRVKVNKFTLVDGSSCGGDASPTRHHNA
jgi:hypothetical protein